MPFGFLDRFRRPPTLTQEQREDLEEQYHVLASELRRLQAHMGTTVTCSSCPTEHNPAADSLVRRTRAVRKAMAHLERQLGAPPAPRGPVSKRATRTR